MQVSISGNASLELSACTIHRPMALTGRRVLIININFYSRCMMKEPIDFVITWLDGNDPEWYALYLKHKADARDLRPESVSPTRFRDWETLHFWFRSIEKYCPWVNKIHLITFGHVPSWMNVSHSKLNIVRHEDIIPSEFLPTFNSRVIELHIHKIKNLSDRFVYFNDDMFILRPTPPDYFFKNNLPCDSLLMEPLHQKGNSHHLSNVQLNAMNVINLFFRKRTLISRNFFKVFNYRYPLKNNISNILLSFYHYFLGFNNFHTAQPYLKKTFEVVWEKSPEILTETGRSKFRQHSNVNPYLMRYWALASGDFFPSRKFKHSKYLSLNESNIDRIIEYLSDSEGLHEICINDCESSNNFEDLKEKLKEGFLVNLKEPSSFEVEMTI